jgi:hypothetical protein
MNENTSSTNLRKILESFDDENSPFVEPKPFIPEEELIAAGVYNLGKDDWIKLLELVNNSDMPYKKRDLLQYKLAIMLYQKYVD